MWKSPYLHIGTSACCCTGLCCEKETIIASSIKGRLGNLTSHRSCRMGGFCLSVFICHAKMPTKITSNNDINQRAVSTVQGLAMTMETRTKSRRVKEKALVMGCGERSGTPGQARIHSNRQKTCSVTSCFGSRLANHPVSTRGLSPPPKPAG